MESSHNLNLSPIPTKPTVPPISSKSDGNDRNYPPSIHNLDSRILGETEKTVKKKVLMERNEPMDLKFSENPSSEIPNVDMKLPYDPLTNYLSPRPKFLRYKPSRRREIFLRRVEEENFGIGEGFLRTVGEDSVLVSHNSSSEEEMQEKEKLEEESGGKSSEIDEEIEEEEEEEGEGDENKGWFVKELLKFLLVIASLVLCTAYITSMNTPTPSFEVSGAFRSGFFPILNNTDEFRSSVVVESINANGSNFWDEEVTEAASNMSSEGVSQFVHHEDENNIGFIEETEILNGENEGKAVYGDLVMLEYTEQVEEAREKPLAGESVIEEMAEGEENGVESSELIFEDDGDREKGKESKISNTISEEEEITEASKINGFDEDNLLSDILTAAENEYTSEMETVEKEGVGDLEMIESITGEAESFVLEARKMETLEKEEVGDLEMIESNTGEAESFVLEARKITILERIANCISSFVEDIEKLKSELIELIHTEAESVFKAVLGLSVSSAILTCLILASQFKNKKDDKKEPAISASVKSTLLQSSVAEAEKVITRESPLVKPTCVVNRSNNEPIRNVGSFKPLSSSIHSRDEMESFKENHHKPLSSSIHSRDEMESFKENHHHEAPTVQFLGEFVVGEISNSLKNKSGLDNRMIEVEDSNFPVSVEEKPVSKNMNSGPEQALSEFSTTSSPTYGSFTSSKRKIVKKKVGGDGEVKSIPTPVRRSSRIRNRIVSP